ncbi:anti-sigma factor [Microbacterium proteolyticum]|uniref:anti-sigma factor n=1 Tax=Microbacterium proteolyticum TaxID=1572644 RepID=UPI00241723B1|nr:anti-sigma factor [Microbacterium proteolyticum]
MRTPDDRWAELVAAALAGELSAAETVEFDELRRNDPRRGEEYASLQGVAQRLRHGDVTWVAPRDTSELEDRILASIQRENAVGAAPSPGARVGTRRRRAWLTPLVAAACLLIGIVVGVNSAGAFTPAIPVGPPGTLGALEQIQVSDDTAGVDVDAQLVAHTWGTEAYLEARGLNVGRTYELVFVAADGEEFTAGEVLGSEVPIVCRMNAAVLRGDTVRMELRDGPDVVVAHADLPRV